MEQERKLPKNIRQMAEKEERARVYLEDYVYTFIHKNGFTGEVRTGILLGEKAVVENENCWFVKGAVEVDNEAAKSGAGGTFTEQLWEQTQAVIQEYFPDCGVCGWFISSAEEDFPDREELKKTHMNIFSRENCLMYWKSGDEDSFWMEDEEKLVHLKGYYVYYEKNVQMQEYMLSRKEEPGESVSDEAAKNFRKIMKEKKENKSHGSKLHNSGKGSAKQLASKKAVKTPQNEKADNENTPVGKIGVTKETAMKAGVAAAAVMAVIGATALLGSIGSGKDDGSVQALAVGASVERQSGTTFEKADESTGDGESKGSSAANETDSTYQDAAESSAEILSGNDSNASPEDGLAQVSDGKEVQQTRAESDTAAETQSAAASADLFSGDMLFYKDGLGAKVYRITAPAKEESSEEESSEETQSEGENLTAGTGRDGTGSAGASEEAGAGEEAEAGEEANAGVGDVAEAGVGDVAEAGAGEEANAGAGEEANAGAGAEAAAGGSAEGEGVQTQQVGAGVADRPASYIVQPGDTLTAISNKFYGSSGMVMQLKEANSLEDINKIYIGQELVLP